MTELGVLAPTGFVAGGIASGIKPDGVPDLALVATADRRAVSAAGVFTTNLACAAPVQVSRAHLANGQAAAIVLSSGNANAATGDQGRADATRMTELTGQGLGCATDDVLVCSTGLIGYVMPMAALETGIPALCADLNGGAAAADAILTTDTVRKEAVATVGAGPALVGGLAKGAAMLAPAMATMLAALTTDAQVTPEVLQHALGEAVSTTFNRLLVDGSTSTNDTVLILANGAAGVSISSRAEIHAFTDAVTDVCGSLAEQMARDAEGATKFVRIRVDGARTAEDAHRGSVCRRIPTRPVLVQRGGPVLGSHSLRARRERGHVRPGGRDHLLQRHGRVPSGHRRGDRGRHAGGDHGRARHRCRV